MLKNHPMFPIPMLAAVVASGCALFQPRTEPAPPTVASEFDASLPEAADKLAAREAWSKLPDAPKFVWLGSRESTWRMARHPSSGVLTGRSVELVFVFRYQDKCLWNTATVVQDHVSDGEFGTMKIEGKFVDYTDGGLLGKGGHRPFGSPVECDVGRSRGGFAVPAGP